MAQADDSWKINLKNADIREFVTQVSAITGKSFIIDPRVKGDVTVISNVNMDEESVYQLFLSVLQVHGFAAVSAGSAIKIVQTVLAKQSSNPDDFVDDLESQELVTRVITVTNAPSEEMVKVLRPLIPQYGHIAALSEPNVLIISDHASNINRLVEIINRVDIADSLEVAIINLKEAWVEDMVKLLEELAPDQIGKSAKGPNRISIVASERTNSLVIKGERYTLARVKALVDQLDVPANRSGTIKVIQLSHSDATKMAEILSNLISSKSKSSEDSMVEVSIQADEAINALVIRADPSNMIDLIGIIESLDVRRMQVLIEAAIVEVTSDFSQQLGSELAVGDASTGTTPLGLTAPSGTLAQILQGLAAPSGLISPPSSFGESPLIAGGKVSTTGTSFAFIVKALAANSDVNLLSTPSITTMDNEEAKIVVGQNVPFRTGSTVTGSQGTTNPFTTIQREDVGLTLEVTPHINSDSLVRLLIHQEVSEVDASSLTVIGSEAAADLITNKRTIDTTILVENGEVIILGGLIRDKETQAESRVPLLGSIPGLGALFRSRTKNIEKQNLLVFLRPTVLTSGADVAAASERKFNRIFEVEIEGNGRNTAERLSDLLDGRL
ncbi:type II secretion system secretin GspD [Pseudomonadales bacterium]|nr:type II secretion system secretin GspD [Gammaproteobacteria bacterium]MDA7590508.1 type II secretion system secretin GspD [Pseudomonadales bacterium]MCH9821601.1 type II secretion system secretin GspD [Gammaproteobacteria bacterium]MDA7718268.1 type II secretion system secretin GspD [Pseudomonadales bacterium]MDA8950842.1 type II secretion system secretin GspD [Pseudomonadales bacterium]